MHHILNDRKGDFDKSIDHLSNELSGLRTGRAHPGLVENITVIAYETATPLKSLASIAVPDSRTLQIEPWDQGIIKDVEKALTQAQVGSNPNVDGKIIRLTMPQMTEETRKKIVKVVKEKLEEARVAIRQIREDIRKEVQKMEQAKEVTEDERYKIFDELDTMTKEFVTTIDEKGVTKEKEIMTI